MSSKNFNNLRTLRIQLKLGYLKQEPPEFTFMKRYPPLDRRSKPPLRSVDLTKIPYVGLYKEIKAKNPLLEDERVYPAFWEQEPQALTMARKQYEFIHFKGMKPDEAYKEAKKFVGNMESIAYDELKRVNKVLDDMGTAKSFLADPVIADFVAYWRKVLESTPFHQLSLADQGEVDFFIQANILKWKEVERERRMKDPIFVMQFDRLRDLLFPEIAGSRKVAAHEQRTSYEAKSTVTEIMGVKLHRLRTSYPFYVDDYRNYFEKIKKQPILSRWPEVEVDRFSRWVMDTLSFFELTDPHINSHPDRTNPTLSTYLDTLRVHFFPMLQYPDKAATFNLPSNDEIRSILYAKDVGYKKVDGKLFVKRFYLLPGLLFPEETLTTSLLRDMKKHMSAMVSDGYLKSEMSKAGLEEAPVSAIKEKLEKYMQNVPKPKKAAPAYGRSYGADFSALDSLLGDVSRDRNTLPQEQSMALLIEPTDKQKDAWAVLQDSFHAFTALAESLLPKDAPQLVQFKAYVEGQLAACAPRKTFYLDPESDLVFFCKFVDDVSSLLYMMKTSQDESSHVQFEDLVRNSASYRSLTRDTSPEVTAAVNEAFATFFSKFTAKRLEAFDEMIAFAEREPTVLAKFRHLVTLGKLVAPSDLLPYEVAPQTSSLSGVEESVIYPNLVRIKRIAVNNASDFFYRELEPNELELITFLTNLDRQNKQSNIEVDPNDFYDMQMSVSREELTRKLDRPPNFVEERLLRIVVETQKALHYNLLPAVAADETSSDGSSKSVTPLDDAVGNALSAKEIILSDEEREALLVKYSLVAKSTLDADRDEYLRAVVQRGPEDAKTEADLYLLNHERMDTQIITRARFSRLYEQKEAARRVREMKARDVLPVSKRRPLRLV